MLLASISPFMQAGFYERLHNDKQGDLSLIPAALSLELCERSEDITAWSDASVAPHLAASMVRLQRITTYPLINRSVFAFEAFLMAGGWLVFGDAQILWTGRNERRNERGSVAHHAKDGAKRRPKLVLRTLKNTSR